MGDALVHIERRGFFSNAMLIKSLCSARAFERMLEIRDHVLSDTDARMDHLALGYKLVVQSGLWGLLDHLIRFPELLELRREPHLIRWWKIVQGQDETTLKGAICDPETDFARITTGIDDLMTSVLRTGVSWDRIADVNERLDRLSDELLEVARLCTASSHNDSRPEGPVDRFLEATIVNRLYDSWIEGVDSPAFRYCLRKPTQWTHIELPGQAMFDIQTYRDQLGWLPAYSAFEFEPGWIVGKLSAVIVSLLETNQWSAGLGDPHRLLRQNSDPNRAWEAGTRMFRSTSGLELTAFETGLGAVAETPT